MRTKFGRTAESFIFYFDLSLRIVFPLRAGIGLIFRMRLLVFFSSPSFGLGLEGLMEFVRLFIHWSDVVIFQKENQVAGFMWFRFMGSFKE